MAVAEILVVNAGSSSFKFAVYSAETPGKRVLHGQVDRLGSIEPSAVVEAAGAELRQSTLRNVSADGLADWLLDALAGRRIVAVGHRLVHGGAKLRAPVRVTDDVLRELRSLVELDPSHLPAALGWLEQLGKRFSGVPQVACFDTAFHRGLPRAAGLLPLPRRFYERGVRRYGFHGLAYASVMRELGRRTEAERAPARAVLAHLGSGASLAAVLDGRCIDTTMAYTPNSGIPMGTRSGDLDAGLLVHLMRNEGLASDQLERLLTRESGLLGLSGSSADMRELLERRGTDEHAADAVDVFCYSVKKAIGAFTAALGGLDVLAFSGGIGEHAPACRAQICAGLAVFGVSLDERRNAANDAVISSADSRVTVHVVAADEEVIIAEATAELLKETP